MTGFFDQASEDEDKFRDYSVARQRAKNQPIKFTGRCLSEHCNAQIEKGRFCDSWCREDYEHGLRMKKILGR